ncbi:peptide ABC transporter permease [Chelatococcus sp. GCM10030263]|jgi:hypothetical protein|uniref:peptide ABC transporter permease n=1 Tax=Chelatococcus sp. GCM10030263 TaxID=3273387 RepID=UPI0036202B32
MADRMTDDRKPEQPTTISGQDARQGEIILRTRTRRLIFIAGLAAVVILALLWRIGVFG